MIQLNPQKGYMPIQVEPTLDKPLPPVNTKHDLGEDYPDRLKIAGNTAYLHKELGASFEMTEEDHVKAGKLFEEMNKKSGTPEEEMALENPSVALGLATYINEYERQVVQDKVQVRTIVTNRLLQMSQSDDQKIAIKALELLGKASDLFVEHSEITITHKNSNELKEAIKERIRTLMQMNTIDVAPKAERLANSLDTKKKNDNSDSRKSIDV